jgi:hypothetical protein
MSEVLIEGADKAHPPERFEHLKHLCLEPQLCWLKNGYFRHDEGFYGELAAALEQKRRRRAVWSRARRALRRMGERFPALARGYHRARNGSRPARVWLKRTLGLPLTRAL